jgi:hypothetical protein
MALTSFRLSPDQNANEYVVVLADDGGTRVITRISRKAVDDRFGSNGLSQKDRVSTIERNLQAVSALIVEKYGAKEFTAYTDKFGITDDNNKLIIITSQELQRCEMR